MTHLSHKSDTFIDRDLCILKVQSVERMSANSFLGSKTHVLASYVLSEVPFQTFKHLKYITRKKYIDIIMVSPDCTATV